MRAGPAAIGLLWIGSASAQPANRPVPDLKQIPPGQQVVAVAFCRGGYEVSLAALAFKTDSSANGPTSSKPALVPTGRVGDRAFVVFADVTELRRTLKAECQD